MYDTQELEHAILLGIGEGIENIITTDGNAEIVIEVIAGFDIHEDFTAIFRGIRRITRAEESARGAP